MMDDFIIGDVIVFNNYSKDVVKWGNNDDPIEKGLLLNNKYTIKNIDVHSWHTKIEIEGFDGKFNSVHFEKENKIS